MKASGVAAADSLLSYFCHTFFDGIAETFAYYPIAGRTCYDNYRNSCSCVVCLIVFKQICFRNAQIPQDVHERKTY